MVNVAMLGAGVRMLFSPAGLAIAGTMAAIYLGKQAWDAFSESVRRASGNLMNAGAAGFVRAAGAAGETTAAVEKTSAAIATTTGSLDLFGKKAKETKEHLGTFRLESEATAALLGRIGTDMKNWAWLQVIGERASAAAKKIEEIYLNLERLRQQGFEAWKDLENFPAPAAPSGGIPSGPSAPTFPTLPGVESQAKWKADREAYARELDEIQQLYSDGIISADEYTAALEDLQNKYRGVAQASTQAAASQGVVAKGMQAVSTIVTDMSRGIAQAIVYGGKLSDVFKKTAQEIATALIRVVIEGALKRLTDTLTGLINKTIPSLGGVFGKLGNIGSIFGGGGSSSAAGGLTGAASSVSSAVGSAGGGVAGAAGSMLSSVVGGLLGGGLSMVGSLISGFMIKGAIKGLDSTMRGQTGLLTSQVLQTNEYLPVLKSIHERIMQIMQAGLKVYTSWDDPLQVQMAGQAGGGVGGVTLQINGGYFMSPRAQEDFFQSFVEFLRARGVHI
jgi:hypothetical protein